MALPRTSRHLASSFLSGTSQGRAIHCTRLATPQMLRGLAANQTTACRSFATSRQRNGGHGGKSSAKLQRRASKLGLETELEQGVSPADMAFDFTETEAKILKIIEHFTHQLAQTRAGGQIDLALVENIVVPLRGLNSSSKHGVKLRDLAQVTTKGRNVLIIANEEQNVKHIRSAIQASQHNLTPIGPTPEAPTSLTVRNPPPTSESRRAAVDTANKLGQQAIDALRAARQDHSSKLRTLTLLHKLSTENQRRATHDLDEIINKGKKEVERIRDGAREVFQLKA